MSPADPLRVLHIASPAAVGGLERVLHALAVGHHRRGHEIHVAALLGADDANPAFVEPLRAAGVPVHVKAVSLASVWSERRFVRDLCRRIRPDVAHTHGYRPDLVDSDVVRRLGIASVSTEHGFSKMGGRTAIYEWLQMRWFPRFDAVVAVSPHIADAMRRAGVDPARCHTIANAWSGSVDFLDRRAARSALQIAEDAFAVGFIGRMIPVKGADVLVRALARVADPQVVGVFIGDGPERDRCAKLAAQLKIAHAPIFAGEILEAAPYLRAFDLFALPSRSEGTPIVLLEAMAAGVPIVATAVGGVPDVVGDAEAMRVAADDPAALAEAIGFARAHPERNAARVAAASRRLADHYALDPWLDRYEQVYRGVLADRSE